MTKQLLAATLTATALFTFAMSKITGAETDRTRIYFIGNSLTDEVKYKDFVKLAKDGGEEVIWGRHMIPGCPIRGLWGAKGGFQKPPFGHWQKALRDFEWDVVTMQPFCPFPGEYEHALLFAKETIKKSPEALICIYAQWPHINQGPDWDQAFTRPTRQSKGANSAKMPDFSYNHVVDTAVPPELRERYRENSLRNDYEVIVYGLRANLKSKKPAVLIPAGHAMQLLGQKMQAGLVPGYRTPWDFYSDGCHVNNDASYLVACAFYATIFGKSPVGLPVGGYQGKPGFRDDGVHISPEMARIIQETVWEVVATHPLTGVTSDEPFKIASPILAPAVGGEPYLYELIPAFGKAPYKWSLAAGALPEGITLSSGGTLSGVPAKPGKSEATFQVTDAKGATTRKRLDLSVAEDTAPTIPEQKIPAQSVGKFFEYQLKSQGGNGAHKWSVKDDESIFGSQTLPFGLSLDPNGRLSGSPGKEGTCTFQLVRRQREPRDRRADIHLGSRPTRRRDRNRAPAGQRGETLRLERGTRPLSMEIPLSHQKTRPGRQGHRQRRLRHRLGRRASLGRRQGQRSHQHSRFPGRLFRRRQHRPLP